MATPLVSVNWERFQMMLFIIILKVRKFHWPTTIRFGTTRQKPIAIGIGFSFVCSIWRT